MQLGSSFDTLGKDEQLGLSIADILSILYHLHFYLSQTPSSFVCRSKASKVEGINLDQVVNCNNNQLKSYKHCNILFNRVEEMLTQFKVILKFRTLALG